MRRIIARDEYKIRNSTIGTRGESQYPVLEASPDPRSFWYKNINDQTSGGKILQSNRKWNMIKRLGGIWPKILFEKYLDFRTRENERKTIKHHSWLESRVHFFSTSVLDE